MAGAKSEAVVLRPHRPGDLGWIIHRHGSLYAQEYGWDMHFEAHVAQIAADFLNHFNPEKEHCFIADKQGETIGSAIVCQSSAETARLQLLLVEPSERGTGLGSRLMAECILFARKAGYQKLQIRTTNVLVEARHIIKKAGFQLLELETQRSYGKLLILETWELDL